jgi:FHA domain
VRLEVKYPDKPAHEVELRLTVVVLGRDPSCDLVINDERCSRRHAVMELTPTGLQVRDAGSANGIFVNGKKVERAGLVKGDLVRLGEVIVKVLPEDTPGTLVMANEDLEDLGTAPGMPAPPQGPTTLGTDAIPRRAAPYPKARNPPSDAAARPSPADRGARRDPAPSPLPRPAAKGPVPRPLTVTLLGGLWLVSIVLYAAAALGAAPLLGLQGMTAAATIAVSALLAFLSALMAYGLFTLRPWARLLQAGVAGLGLVVCPFTLASATVLIYVLRPSTQTAFDGPAGKGAPDPGEMTFALTLIGTVVVGAGLCLAGGLMARFAR